LRFESWFKESFYGSAEIEIMFWKRGRGAAGERAETKNFLDFKIDET